VEQLTTSYDSAPEGEKGKYMPTRPNTLVASGERTILALIDTGSDVTLIGRLLAEQLNWDICLYICPN